MAAARGACRYLNDNNFLLTKVADFDRKYAAKGGNRLVPKSKGSMKTSANLCKWLLVSAFVFFAATTLSQAQPSNCTPSPTGLVSWWKAEGNGLDSVSGNSAYAALLPGGATFAPGEVGQAFLLDNTNAYLFVPASPSLNVGAGTGLTMEGWIKVSSVSGFHPIAEWHGDTRETAGVQLWLNSYPTQSGALFGAVTDTNWGQHTLVSASGIVQPNVFQHVALTYDKASGIGTLYLNGAVVAQVNLGSFVPATADDLWIAHRPLDVPGDWTYGTTLGGLLDELSIYSRALSATEIAAIYTASSAGKCDGSNKSSMAPTITQQPTNQTAAAGGTAAFSVTATGSAPLSYQWYGPGSSVVVGAVNSTLTLSNVQPGNAGSYFVLVTNANGFAQSSNAVLTVTGSGGNTNSCTPPPSGLISLWKGDGNPGDSAGTNNGFVTGGSISYAAGQVNTAFHYTNGSGYVEVPAAPSLNVGQGAGFTIEAWIQPADIVNEIPILEWQYNTNNGYSGTHFWISAIGGAGCLFANIVDSTNNSHWLFSAPGIVTSDYQHVALTYDKSSGVASIYRNGLLVAHTNIGSFTPNTTGNLLLGERTYLNGDPQFHYVGGLDEMSLYSRALSSNEIATIYNAGTNGKCGGVTNSGTAPIITSQPTNQTVALGSNAMFSVTVTGTAPLHYQWFGPSNALIAGAITSTLTLSNVQQSAAGTYFVSVTNQFGFAGSSNAVLTVTGNTNSGMAPVITQQPTNETVAIGGTAVFSVMATGSPTPHYQWFGPTGAISGAATSTLTLSNVQPSAAGSYFAAVTNMFGINASATIVLTVTGGITNSCTPPPSGLVGWWPGEGNANDVVGGNNGTLVHGVGFAAGEVGQGFLFTHTNQNVLIPANSNLNVGLGSGLTLEAWINPTDLTNYDPIFEWNQGDGVTYWGVHMYALPTGTTNAGFLYANVQDVGDNWHQLQSSGSVVTPNAFQHVALTYDKTSGVARLYRNGAVVAEGTFGSFTPKTTGNLNIGNRPTDPANESFTFSGVIYVPSVYGRALSSHEIAAIYNAGSFGKCGGVTNSGTAPVITHQPTNQTVAIGGTAAFSVTATGTPTLYYQWFGPTGAISGAMTSKKFLMQPIPR